MNMTTLRWWLVVVTSLFGLAYAGHLGLLTKLWLVDQSHLSYITLAIFGIVTSFIGYLSYVLTKNAPTSVVFEDHLKYLHPCWFASEVMMGLGMIGTLVGFMMMLGPAFTGLDVANIDAMKTAIIKMAEGMSTAVTTTLVGLACSLVTKVQLINLEMALPDELEETN
jgi:hypothetical protein